MGVRFLEFPIKIRRDTSGLAIQYFKLSIILYVFKILASKQLLILVFSIPLLKTIQN